MQMTKEHLIQMHKNHLDYKYLISKSCRH